MTKTNNVTIAQVLDFIGVESVLHYSPEGSDVRTEIPVHEIVARHPDMLRYALIAGLGGRLGDVSKGGLSKKLDRPATDADLAAERNAIVKNWLDEGTWGRRGSGERDSLVSYQWDAYFAEKGIATEAAKKAERKRIAGKVVARFGNGTSATFGSYLDAVAADLAEAGRGDVAELRERLGNKYLVAAKALRAATSAASAEIGLDDMEAMLG